MRHFIISSHSHLAEGMVSALELIVGKIDNLSFYNAYTEEETGDNEHFKEKIMREINSIPKEDDIIIMTDMFGGSVNNELLELCKIKKLPFSNRNESSISNRTLLGKRRRTN